MLTRLALGLSLTALASGASAQWTPGMEIMGQRVQVQTNGITNTIVFDRGGIAHISSPSGATVVDATWVAEGGKLCLKTDSTFDCYPYRAPFMARHTVPLISDCGVRSDWTALETAVPPGERG